MFKQHCSVQSTPFTSLHHAKRMYNYINQSSCSNSSSNSISSSSCPWSPVSRISTSEVGRTGPHWCQQSFSFQPTLSIIGFGFFNNSFISSFIYTVIHTLEVWFQSSVARRKAGQVNFLTRLSSAPTIFRSLRVKMTHWNWKNWWSTCLPVPPSLGTQDGFFSKTNKASFLHYLLEDTTPGNLPYPKDALFIQDGHCFMFLPTFRQPVVKYVYRYLIRWRPRSTSCSQLTVIIQNP